MRGAGFAPRDLWITPSEVVRGWFDPDMSSRLALAPALALLFAVAACAAPEQRPEPSNAGLEVRAIDGSLSVDVPPDWTELDRSLLTGPTVLAAEGPDGIDQIIVNRFDDQGGAEEQAVWLAAGMAGGGVSCERLESAEALGGRLVLDCPPPAGHGPKFHRILVPVAAREGSVLVFAQVAGDSLQAAAGTVAPILDSLTIS